jgi:hypothetical protein
MSLAKTSHKKPKNLGKKLGKKKNWARGKKCVSAICLWVKKARENSAKRIIIIIL